MNNETKKSAIPRLRFPEFQDAGEWVEKTLGDVAKITTGNTPSTSEAGNYGGNRMFVSPADITGKRYIKQTKTTLTEEGYSKTRHIKADSVLFVCIGSTIGKVAQNKFECATNQQINSVEPKGEHSSGFIYSTLENSAHVIASLAGRQAIPIINKSLFSSVVIKLPSLHEQQKIADCLSSLDELMAAQSQKLNALKTHKKGLMQQLFPAEGETVPRLRFPEFQDAGEWEEKKLSDVARLITEKAGIKRYTLMSITAGLGLISQMDKFGREIAGESYKNYYVIRKGDFAYNKSSTKLYSEGQISVLENDVQGAVPNSIFTCFRVDEKYALPYFLKYPFENNIHGKWLRNFISVGARANGALNVDKKDLLALPLLLPSLPEQQKIADFLSSLDKLIAAQSQKIEALKLHKKGLMQQLFPNPNEIK